jgi:hypothetical protein
MSQGHPRWCHESRRPSRRGSLPRGLPSTPSWEARHREDFWRIELRGGIGSRRVVGVVGRIGKIVPLGCSRGFAYGLFLSLHHLN